MTLFFYSVQLSCSVVARYIAACILRECLGVCSCLSWPHAFWTKINRTYKREFSSVFKETSLILDPHTSTKYILNRHIKYLPQFVQKIGEKNKNKKNGFVKHYVLTRKRKKSKRFLKKLVIY